MLGPAGCGTNLDQVAYETIAAAGRTYLDLALTQAANDLAERREHDNDNDEDDGDEDGGEDGDTGDGDDGGDGDGDVTLDGAPLFAANCAACHGEDGASGFAPDITGKTADEVAAGQELATHSAITLTAEEIAAIAAFLGGEATDTGPTGDASAGEDIFTGSGCTACHCEDAAGGCLPGAPSLLGVETDRLSEQLVGDRTHTGGKFDLTQEDLADLQAYLASLE